MLRASGGTLTTFCFSKYIDIAKRTRSFKRKPAADARRVLSGAYYTQCRRRARNDHDALGYATATTHRMSASNYATRAIAHRRTTRLLRSRLYDDLGTLQRNVVTSTWLTYLRGGRFSWPDNTRRNLAGPFASDRIAIDPARVTYLKMLTTLASFGRING
jgi:hypothetical protein